MLKTSLLLLLLGLQSACAEEVKRSPAVQARAARWQTCLDSGVRSAKLEQSNEEARLVIDERCHALHDAVFEQLVAEKGELPALEDSYEIWRAGQDSIVSGMERRRRRES